MIYLIVLIYLTGVIVAYITGKKYISDNGRLGWTAGDRRKEITLSILFTWLAVIVNMISMITFPNDDKPVKW